MAHVLIGFAEALPAPEVVFSLLAAGHRVSAFARSRALPLAHLPLQGLHVIPAPERDAAATVTALQAVLGGAEPPEVVLPLDDAGLWLVDQAAGPGVRVAGARGAQAAVALDKARQVAAATEAGLEVPPTQVLAGEAVLPQQGWPLIAKPAAAVALRAGRLQKGGSLYLHGPADLPQLAAALRAGQGPLLVQPLLHGGGEGIFGFASPDGIVAWSAHRRVRMMNPHGSGSSACRAIPADPALTARVARFLALIGWRGAFMVELLRDAAGTAWFMELNGRMWGSLALARRQGLEYPAWNVAAALDPGFRPAVPPPQAYAAVQRHLGRELLHPLFVLRGPKSAFHRATWPRFWPSLAAVLRPAPARTFYNYDPAFPRYFLRDALWTVMKALWR